MKKPSSLAIAVIIVVLCELLTVGLIVYNIFFRYPVLHPRIQ